MSLQYTEESPRLRPAGAAIHITDIEAAINWWRERKPSDGVNACAEVRALAEVYGLMVYHREPDCDEATMPGAAREAWLGWYASTPDTPCIAICSTSQGDAVCKGCGRSFAEVQGWPEMSPAEKRATWRRITHEGSAWRFNRYAERAGGASPAPAPAPAPAPGESAAPAPAAPAPMLQQPPEPQAVVAVAPQPHVPPESPAEPVQVSMPPQAPAQAEPPAVPGMPSLPEPDAPPRQAEPLPSLPAEPQPPASLPEPAPLAVAGKAARTAKPVPHPNAARQGQAKRKRARRRKG